MARRHEDRKPGQRFARGGSAARKRSATKKKTAGKKPARRQPQRGSKRRQEGLVVKPSSVLGKQSSTRSDGKVRLNHFLAKAGVCSRRNADELIASGRVEVNGELVTELGVRVDPASDDVRFDGSRLQPEKAVHVLFNKPKGVVCTNARHEQKKRVIDLLPTIRGRIFTVGRLDMDSEGLILVTNDGAFAQEMTHPRYGVRKLYSVVVRGRLEDAQLDKARGGVWLSEGPTGGMELKIERLTKERTYLKVTLREGKNREIRRVFAKLGHPVISLKRVRIGNLSLHGLKAGGWRFLQAHEVARLRETARGEVDDVVETNRR
ncbi:MAG TPA: rRNA pseudouridine synthase [bacterium]|nr:rRNA pseudouridine synthase [bacterium]